MYSHIIKNLCSNPSLVWKETEFNDSLKEQLTQELSTAAHIVKRFGNKPLTFRHFSSPKVRAEVPGSQSLYIRLHLSVVFTKEHAGSETDAFCSSQIEVNNQRAPLSQEETTLLVECLESKLNITACACYTCSASDKKRNASMN